MANLELSQIKLIHGKLKPPEVRLATWNASLTRVFDWESRNINALMDISTYEKLLDIPETIDSISKLVEIDTAISELIKKSKSAENERKDLTKPMDDVKKRLMEIEKAYSSISEAVKAKFLKIKTIENNEKRKAEARKALVSNFTITVKNYYSDQMGYNRRYIQDFCLEKFKHALDNIQPSDINDVIEEIIEEHKYSGLHCLSYKMSAVELQDAELVDVANAAKSVFDRTLLLNEFESSMRTTFEGFAQAVENKKQAILFAESEKLLNTQAIEQETQEDQSLFFIEAKVEAAEAPKATNDGMSFSATKRDVKNFWAVEMEHNASTLSIVDKAFYANMDDCLSIYRGGDVWLIDAVKKAELLSKLKDKDPNFDFPGLIFVEKSKI
jgi:hypothetical protein